MLAPSTVPRSRAPGEPGQPTSAGSSDYQQLTIKTKLHVASARRLSASSGDLDTDISSRDEDLGDGDTVVGNEHDTQKVADVRVVVLRVSAVPGLIRSQ